MFQPASRDFLCVPPKQTGRASPACSYCSSQRFSCQRVSFDGFQQLLPAQKCTISSAGGDKILVSPLLDDFPLVEHDDPACLADAAYPMGGYERRPADQSPPKRAQNVGFGAG